MNILIQNKQFTQSRMLKIYEQIQQLGYLACPKNEHQFAPLNMICADCQCKQTQLLCIHCQQQHAQHDVIPLKQYLLKVSISSKVLWETEKNVKWTTEMQHAKKQCIQSLLNFKQQICEKVDGIIHEINIQHQQYSFKIKQILNLSSELQKIIKNYDNTCSYIHQKQAKLANTIDKRVQQQQQNNQKFWKQYLSNLKKLNTKFKQIMRYTAVQSFQQVHDSDEGRKQFVTANLANQIKIINISYSQKCRNVNKTLQKSYIDFSQKCNKMIQNLQEKVFTISPIKSKKFSWSQSNKATAIIIKEHLVERIAGNSAERFALFNEQLIPGIHCKNKKVLWALRIAKLNSWIGVGVCLKNKIVSVGYKFTYENLGHGSYMISSNGYTWSSSVAVMNSAYSSFSFTTGDFIIMQFDSSPIWMVNFYICKQQTLLAKANKNVKDYPYIYIKPKSVQKLKNSASQLPLCISLSDLTKTKSLSLQQSADYYPCVNLSSVGDCVQICSL